MGEWLFVVRRTMPPAWRNCYHGGACSKAGSWGVLARDIQPCKNELAVGSKNVAHARQTKEASSCLLMRYRKRRRRLCCIYTQTLAHVGA
jgi:hypothetical protein